MPDAVSLNKFVIPESAGTMTFSFFCSSLKGQSLFEKKWLGGFRIKVSLVGMGRSTKKNLNLL